MRAARPYQPSLFDQPVKPPAIVFDMNAGKRLAKAGMDLAVETANKEHKDWNKRCWQLFLLWLRRNVKVGQEFQIEDFREHVYKMDLLEKPKSNRAFGNLAWWGKNKYFLFVRNDKVRNKTAHGANAAVWVKI